MRLAVVTHGVRHNAHGENIGQTVWRKEVETPADNPQSNRVGLARENLNRLLDTSQRRDGLAKMRLVR